MFDYIWRRKSKFGWLQKLEWSLSKTEVFTAAGSMRAMNSDGRQALKLRPGGTKDDSFPCSRQQMIRPKHMLGSLYMGELSSQLIVICVNPFSCDKLCLFLLRLMFWAVVAVGPGPGHVHELRDKCFHLVRPSATLTGPAPLPPPPVNAVRRHAVDAS